jgi:hypothetical protein
LNDKTLAGVVVSLALPAPAELDLKALEVGLALDKLDERLKREIDTVETRAIAATSSTRGPLRVLRNCIAKSLAMF